MIDVFVRICAGCNGDGSRDGWTYQLMREELPKEKSQEQTTVSDKKIS